MTRNNLLVFDLDGTLLDSLPSLAKSFNWALQKMGHPIHPVTNYKYIIAVSYTHLTLPTSDLV